jgi:nucleoredoxin
MDSVLGGVSLIDKSGNKVSPSSLGSNKIVGLYFSAHWCPPCRGFTPVLANAYKTLTDQGKPIQIIFISSDRDQGQFDGYYNEMPWLALPFSERDAKSKLSEKYGITGIPTLVLLDGATGELKTKDGRGEITADPVLAKFLS